MLFNNEAKKRKKAEAELKKEIENVEAIVQRQKLINEIAALRADKEKDRNITHNRVMKKIEVLKNEAHDHSNDDLINDLQLLLNERVRDSKVKNP